jgi:hypothetical protein
VRALFTPRDRIKLLVLLILVIILAVLVLSRKQMPIVQVGVIENNRSPAETIVDGAQAQELPELPAAGGRLVLNAERNALADLLGEVIYTLSENVEKWVPVIKPTFEKELPDGYLLTEDENGTWAILASSGEVLFIFNQQNFGWDMQDQPPVENTESEVMSEPLLSCPLANPVRISGMGQKVRVINAVIPLRASPAVNSRNILMPLVQGTNLEVVGGPVCTPYLDGANVWWIVRAPDGLKGYAAEGSAASATYYLTPIH